MEYVLFILVVIAMIIVAKFLSWPLKKIFKLIFNVILGLVMILLVNVFGVSIGLSIPFNFVTAAVSGFLGLPGVIVLVILHYIF